MLVQVFAPKHLGDLVASLPALRMLGGDALHVVAQGALREFVSTQGDWTTGSPRRGGCAVLFRPSLRASLEARRAGCRPIVGLPGDGRSLVLTHPVPRADELGHRGLPRLLPREHQAESYRRIAGFALDLLDRPPAPAMLGLRLTEDDAHRGGRAWESLGRPDVVIHPCAAGPLKAGDLDVWAAQGAAWISEGLVVAVTGGPSPRDARRAQRLAEVLGVAVKAGMDSIPLIEWAEMSRRTRLVLGPDTGIMHLAAAVGANVAVVFGPTDPRRHRPEGTGTVTVVDGGAGMDCAPCYGSICIHGVTPECLRSPVVVWDMPVPAEAAP